jgi:hypothetical protein
MTFLDGLYKIVTKDNSFMTFLDGLYKIVTKE